jgi:hypothetical protein
MTKRASPRLLNQLASLTAIKDVEMMELSLLKTLKGFLLLSVLA